MALRGLFAGIDRYKSVDVPWLSCAARDATALHALFTDTLGDGAILLSDDQATRSAIQQQFESLAACDPDDVVVVAFSGHGSETHELVTYDADLDDLPGSCIPLDTLTEWFSRIPARRLICFLDCCFSGGVGAKVLHVDVKPRSLNSANSLLDQLSGDGRLILTASTATEEAWENGKIGHGLLTYYLLEALQGAEEVREAGKISVYQLLSYVTRRVTAGATQFGKPQHPTLRGQLDGELTWPVFTPGARYRAAFPERMRPAATADVRSLAAYGFPTALLDAWAGSIPSLNALQLAAINEFNLLEGEHLVVSAPTSSGKTMIGELAALRGTIDRKRSLFLLPLKALVNDKYQQFNRTYGSFGLRTIRATGETIDDVPALVRGQYDICLLTYEKFSALVLGAPHILDQVSTVVIDEVQMITDESRGINLEFILTLLRMRRQIGIEPQVIALSAVIGDTNGLERWLGARLLRRDERPVPLDEGIITEAGWFRYIDPDGNEQTARDYVRRQGLKSSAQDWIIPLVRNLVGEGKQVIVFRETRPEARSCALYLARELALPPAQSALDALPTGDPSVASNALRQALEGGVAFHISDLDREERLVIEEHFRAPDTTLRVIAATTTLAMGVNTPASAVIIAGLDHPQDKPYSVAEYKNIIGRAGRLGFTERGTSYIMAITQHDEYRAWNRYVRGKPEDLISRFLDRGVDSRSLVVRVLAAAKKATANAMEAADIIAFLEGSFGAFQQAQSSERWHWSREQLGDALGDLERHELVTRDQDGRYKLSELGQLAGEGGIEVESITRLVDAFRHLDPSELTDPTIVAATQLAAELDQVYFPMNKSSTIKEPQTWSNALQQQGVARAVMQARFRTAVDQPQSTARAKKATACLLWVTDWPMSEIETFLTQHGGKFDGAAGAVRSTSSRVCDLLPTVMRVAELVQSGLDLTERRIKLLTRMEVGVPAAAFELARQSGSRISRGDYHRLIREGLSSIDAIENGSDASLLACLDGNLEKLAVLRRAVEDHRRSEHEKAPIKPMPTYEAD